MDSAPKEGARDEPLRGLKHRSNWTLPRRLDSNCSVIAFDPTGERHRTCIENLATIAPKSPASPGSELTGRGIGNQGVAATSARHADLHLVQRCCPVATLEPIHPLKSTLEHAPNRRVEE